MTAETDFDAVAHDAPAIQEWLIEQIAFYAEMDPADIAPDVRLSSYRIDSLYALSLCADIEDRYGLPVDATIAWDHPTAEALSRHVAGRLLAERDA
ncbi:acyl carrier protein [Streptomyces sp. NBC_00091]|uniref:acyl carrier protein n=1 Tax=Streptomyces sp. NBC_00091 TaxID=2975648 RepID=UPI00224D3BA1|nr:acyl carrier protein [Streptomyces sp. NBC_00091]MCX5381003.1 acyl carrier protein [Streptomyces sp. NBC_00091]